MFALPLLAALSFVAQANFHITLNGTPMPLHAFDRGVFGVASGTAKNSVEIDTSLDVRWVDVRPLSLHIAPAISDHHRLSITDLAPGAYTLEFNGTWNNVLHLFIQPPQTDVVREGLPQVRYFGPGVHDAGEIVLHDGETLYLAEGAWVKGWVRSQGTRAARICGRGVLDASGNGKQKAISFDHTENTVIEGITVFNSQTWTVLIQNSRGTHIHHFNLLDTKEGADGIDLVSSSSVEIDHVFLRANDDCITVKTWNGIDVHGISVHQATVWNMPWGNALEIGFELRANSVDDIRFEDIDIIHVEHGAALSIHNGDRAAVSNVVYDNVRIENASQKLIDLAVIYGKYGADKPGSPAEAARRYDYGPWDGVLTYPPDEAAERARFRGQIRNIRFHNIRVVDGGLPFSVIAGFDAQHEVSGVTIDGLFFCHRRLTTAQAAKFDIENARNVVFQ